MRIRMDQLNVPDKIHFHKQTNEIIYNDLLQSTLNISRLETRVSKLLGQLEQEKAENKAWQVQVKRLESDIMVVGEEPSKIQPIKKLPDEKGNTIQVLRKQLKIATTKHIQNTKLTTLQQEKDSLQQEIINYKA